MERSHLAVLLGLLAFAAGATAVEVAQAAGATTTEASCEPSVLATQVLLFCAPDMPTVQCCEPVVASVDLGGGVPCLCRVAAEPQLIISGLNATHLLTLYAACGGLRQGGPRLAAACEGPAPPTSVVRVRLPPPAALQRMLPAREARPPPPATEKLSPLPQHYDDSDHNKRTAGTTAHTDCISGTLAEEVGLHCRGTASAPSRSCCRPVMAAVDLYGGISCLCLVAGEPEVIQHINQTRLLSIYTACGGVALSAQCDGAPAPPPPPTVVFRSPPPPPLVFSAPPPPAFQSAPPPPPKTRDGPTTTIIIVVLIIVVISGAIYLVRVKWTRSTSQNRMEFEMHQIEEQQEEFREALEPEQKEEVGEEQQHALEVSDDVELGVRSMVVLDLQHDVGAASEFPSELQHVVGAASEFPSELQHDVGAASEFPSELQHDVGEASEFPSELQHDVGEASEFPSELQHDVGAASESCLLIRQTKKKRHSKKKRSA